MEEACQKEFGFEIPVYEPIEIEVGGNDIEESQMKLGDVLKKEREGRGLSHVELSVEEVADKLGISEDEYRQIEAGESPAELWASHLAHIAIALGTPTSRLLAESGQFQDTNPGQAGELIRGHRREREKTIEEMVESLNSYQEMTVQDGYEPLTLEDYEQVEAGESPIEKYGPLCLGFAEVIEQPVFNLFYPCGLPFQELDDYP